MQTRPALSFSPFLALALATAAVAQAPATVRVETLDLAAIEQEWGNPQPGHSVDGKPIRIAGVAFEHGLGTHANSEWAISLGGGSKSFSAMVGVDDEVGSDAASVVFVVHVDGKEVARSKVMRKGMAAERLQADLTGGKELLLVVEDAGDSINYDHADWADAQITLAGDGKVLPQSVRAANVPAAIAMPKPPTTPHIGYPRITGGSPGKPFLFRIPASGQRPMTFACEGLPAGLQLDAVHGVIRGSLTAAGRFAVKVTVKNAAGNDTRTITVVGEKDALALTPPLGWNSWNCWALAVDDQKVRAAGDVFESSGLADHGFQYINIDDGWEKDRGPDGRIRTNERFPDMVALSEYLHQKGLKFGIYSSPGPKTCGGYEGSWQHEAQDAQSYAAWGVDYLKYDWCSYGDIEPKPDLAGLKKPYLVMRDALRAAPRDILFSLCQYGMGKVWEWGRDVDGNCWRTTGDITDSWSSMAGIGFAQDVPAAFGGPGHWNDPDMLVVGHVGWGPNLHPTKLTQHEQITHLTLWTMLPSPLLIGCDLTKLDPFTLALLTNDDVLAIHQDALGKPGKRIAKEGTTEVWMRPLVDGTVAVALFDKGRREAPVTVNWQQLGFDAPPPVRDCWLQKDEAGRGEGYTALLQGHGAVLLRVGKIVD